MSDLFLLSERQMARIAPYLPLAHGVPIAQGEPFDIEPIRKRRMIVSAHRCA